MALKRDGYGHRRISFERDALLALPFLHVVLATDAVVGFASADAATKKKARPVKFLTPLSIGGPWHPPASSLLRYSFAGIVLHSSLLDSAEAAGLCNGCRRRRHEADFSNFFIFPRVT
jgi:hypothetical protein